MKMKKIALRGLIGLAICVALCMFFSGTIENITTPKVKLVRASRGKLAQKVELTAQVAFPDTEEYRASVPAGQTLSITRVNVRPGYAVKAGDTLIEAGVTGYQAAREQLQSDCDAALDTLMEVERKNSQIKLHRSEQAYADSYAALRAAVRAASQAQIEMNVALKEAGLSYAQEGYPDGADEALCAQIDAYRAAAEASQEAQADFDRQARRGIDDTVWGYISEKQAAQEKLDDCSARLVELDEQNQAATAICAPHDGYIAAVNVQNGAAYAGSTALYTITPQDAMPVLRADISQIKNQEVSVGMKLSMSTLDMGDLQSQITDIGVDETGKRYADIAVTDEIIQAQGGLYTMTQGTTTFSITFKAADSTCLLPASAVRGSGDNRYVYTVNRESTAFGKEKLTLSKLEVHVLGEADGTASIQEDVSYVDVAYMEDRSLSENSKVMEYLN